MSRLGKLQSACPLLLLALSLVSGSSIAGPPVIAAPVTAQQRIVATPPPGWPHNIYGAGLTTCNRNPGINVVIVYRDPNFGGSCAAMVAGFYPYPQYLGVGDDAISSIKWERVFERAASRTRRTAGATRCSRQGAATRSPRAPSSRRRSLALPRRSAVQCARARASQLRRRARSRQRPNTATARLRAPHASCLSESRGSRASV
jgi:hypothetical protein